MVVEYVCAICALFGTGKSGWLGLGLDSRSLEKVATENVASSQQERTALDLVCLCRSRDTVDISALTDFCF